jgi:hypothetical protein
MAIMNLHSSEKTISRNSAKRYTLGRICAGNGSTLDSYSEMATANAVSRDMGAEVRLEQKEKSLAEIAVYRSWFDENIMKPDPETSSDAVLILPCGSGNPKYRDDHNA